jgi:SAM-dependent methyltransferase
MSAGSIVETQDGSGGGDLTALRGQLHAMWQGVAGGWADHASYSDRRGAPLAERLLDLTAPRPGERVLELACGPGGVGLAAAERVVPGGEVVVSDVAPAMTAVAAARARELGLRNVITRDLDLEFIDEPDASFDVVLCREGLMLVPEPSRAAAEIRRVLRPGGRVALAVWGPRARNPWLGIVFDTVSEQLAVPMPPPGIPGPFSLESPDDLAAVLSAGGLEDVEISEFPTPYRAASAEEWWQRTCALAGPLAQRLGSLPDPAARELQARAQRAIASYEVPGAGLEIPGVSLVAVAHA